MDRNDLDFTTWTAGTEGGTPNFVHFDDKGNPISLRETLTQMAASLSTSDPKKRMPKKKVMSSQERQDLFRWTQETLASGAVEQ